MTEHPTIFIKTEAGNYVPVDDDQEWIAKIRFVFDNGDQFADLLGPLLVRSGAEERWHHYPVPFLFMTEENRKAAAAKRGKNPPQEWWVRRKVNLLRRIAGRELKQVA